MSTTVIFAEILIVGLQALIWIALMILSFFGVDFLSHSSFTNLSQWVQLIIVFVLAIAYTVGIFVDRISDSIFNLQDKTLRKTYLSDDLPSVSKMRIYIMSQNSTVNKYIDYIRSRARIARSTAFNLVFIEFFLLVLYSSKLTSKINSNLIFVISLLLLAALVTAAYSWKRISRTYYKRLEKAYKILKKNEEKKFKSEEEIIDAIEDKSTAGALKNIK